VRMIAAGPFTATFTFITLIIFFYIKQKGYKHKSKKLGQKSRSNNGVTKHSTL